MAKCLLDIKFDIIDKAREMAMGTEDGFRYVLDQRDMLKIVDSKNAALAAKKVNDEFGEMIITPSVTDKTMYYISPSDELVDEYMAEYDRQFTSDAFDINYEEQTRGEYTEEQRGEFFQTETPAVIASEDQLEKVKQIAAKIGVSIQGLDEYAESTGINVDGINGVADLVRKTIAIAKGREAGALTEEVIHMSTAILEQTNPQLVTSLISKIGGFKIYKDTFELYKDNKAYQLANGNPDIRKIKKEAVDKLIAQVMLNDGAVTESFPELEKEDIRNMVQSWWDSILEFIRGLYEKSNIQLFEDAARIISSEDIGTVADIATDGVYYQISNDSVDNFFNMIMADHNDIQGPFPAVYDASGKLIKKRYYTYKGVEVDKTVTEKIDEQKNMAERSADEKLEDGQKAQWGDAGHKFIENYIKEALVDENGYARRGTDGKLAPLTVQIDTTLNPTIQKNLKAFAEKLIGQYKPGTRFLLEKRVVNKSVKGMLASTVDFMAVEPTDDGKSFKLDILDWKFTSINKDLTEDIPWYKKSSWKKQMGEYTKMMYNTGIKPNQLRKTRMVPFIANYKYNVRGDNKSGLNLKSVEIGDINNVKETELYLLPVALDTETTENKKVDNLLSSLRKLYEKLYRRSVSPEEKFIKNIQLNEIEKSIRLLHMKLEFEPLVSVGRTFIENADRILKEMENVDYNTLTPLEISNRLGDLIELENSAEKFATIDDVYLDYINKEELTDEESKILGELRKIDGETGAFLNKITNLRRSFVAQQGVISEITTEETKDIILTPEVEVTTLAKTFLEASKLPSRLIKLASNLIMRAKSLLNIKLNRMADEYGVILNDLEKEAAASGKSAFDMIGREEKGTLKLIKKIDPKFWEELREAKKNGNKQFLLDNVNIEKYNALAEEAIRKGTEVLQSTQFNSDPEQNKKDVDWRVKQLKNNLDLSSPSFTGYDSYQFSYLYNQAMNEEDHLSEDYKKMTPAAKKVWSFFTALNKRAKELGYLEKEGASFFPLMEATTLEKISKSSDLLAEGKDFFKDMYTVRINEEQRYSKIDPETNQIRKQVPTYFKKTDKAVHQLSRDLNKVGVLWIKALLEYENAKTLENTLLTIQAVEKAKGRLLVDEATGDVIIEGGAPKVDEKNNKTADIIMTIIDDHIYGMNENLGSLGNVSINKIAGKVTKDSESKEKATLSTKKVIDNTNKLVQALAVGLKLLVAIPNYVGVNMQAFINAGNLISFSDFQKNNVKITTGIGLSTVEKGLLDLIVPLNEDVSLEKRRELAKNKSYMAWLGTWTLNDIMMVTNSFPEKKLQFANAMTFNNSSMVIDGKIVNIRQYLRKQDREAKIGKSYAERRALDKSFDKRVEELQEKQSLTKIAKIENDKVVIPGVSDEELAKYRTKVIEYARNANGQMSLDNKADYRRDSLFKSFMMFKNWIPKQVSLRTLDIQKNFELDEWEYGRARAFMKVWAHVGFTGIARMRDVILGTDKGLKILDEILEAKREEHFKKTGQQLEITNEEFYDMMKKEITNQMKELGMLFSMLTLILAAKAAEPPEDADELTRNRYKYWAKLTNKISDEIAFYYNPASAEAITKGSVFPALGLLSRAQKAVTHLSRETYGYTINDQEMMDKAHPIKYFLDIIPGPSQFNREFLPIIDPELAKELGIRVTAEARPR